MGDFNKRKYDDNYRNEKLEQCVFTVPKGSRKPLQMIIKAKYNITLSEYIKNMICRDLGIESLHELIQNENKPK